MSRVIVASAGSGKTTSLVREAMASSESVLVVTYTNENLANIRSVFVREAGMIPPHVEVMSWYTFLLSHGARPYHNFVSSGPRAATVNFVAGTAASDPRRRSIPASRVEQYFFDKSRGLYGDKIAEYACRCEERSGGLVSRRLAGIYNKIFIDEVQDLSGWDLEVLKFLLGSPIDVVAVGDPRQATYSTNNSNKNSQYRGAKIVGFFEALAARGLCSVEHQSASRRCSQAICDLADALYPSLAPSSSQNTAATEHDGIFYVGKEAASDYHSQYSPAVLRYDARSNTQGLGGLNFGISKGLTFDRVMIFPTSEMVKWLHGMPSGSLKEITRAKLYVAITRARFSVTFVCAAPPSLQ